MERGTDRLIPNTFERRIREIDRVSQEMKSRQRASGASGQLGYLVQSDQDWDRTETLPTTAEYDYPLCILVLTFTSSDRQWPIVQPITDIRFNGTGESNKLAYDNQGRYTWQSGSNAVLPTWVDQIDQTALEDPLTLKWIIEFDYTGAVTYYVKCRGLATAHGTWSITRTH